VNVRVGKLVPQKLRDNWLRIVVHVGCLLPLAQMSWAYLRGLYVVDPVRELTSQTGRGALVLLLFSLACTPIYALTRFRQVMRVRRALGLYSFLYATLHFLVFSGLDYGFDLGLLGPAILSQRFVLTGAVALLILLALAATSTRSAQRRLGRSWQRLHRFVYLAAALVVLHIALFVKVPRKPLWYGAILATLLALRIPVVRNLLKRVRRTMRGGPEE